MAAHAVPVLTQAVAGLSDQCGHLELENETRRIERLTLPGPGAQEEHDLSVLTYRPEVTLALAQLVNLPERFERMHGSFVDVPALLGYLKREKANGAVRVTTGEDAGVVLLRSGEVLGAYTRQRPELEDADVVFPLARPSQAGQLKDWTAFLHENFSLNWVTLQTNTLASNSFHIFLSPSAEQYRFYRAQWAPDGP